MSQLTILIQLCNIESHAESEESEEAKDESPTDSDVKGDKKKGAGRKGGSKESCDSSEEADSQSADFRCAACSEARLQACFVCGRDEFNGESSRQRCHVGKLPSQRF
ncbi:hypothetical protein LSTR_LSTR016499 [Laodelphax striatellus]|uniref:Uncharacterized protein n=1 Tax=Laodelphax striatellus TaxID=195883 RepID=A0A482XB96_LAOST|nr:hypothetical protein LSTR_LSTR016499 [Laodelphax striatellus]